MNTQEPIPSRPATPESPLTNSLYRATSTIDDLTLALSNFSRVPSPDPPVKINCCCGFEECENLQAWHELKSRLESRLTLSAEVGQALLQRHEAYVRRHEARCRIKRTNDVRQQGSVSDEEDDEDDTIVFRQEQFDLQYAELLKEKMALEKRLNQVLVNSEVTEVSNKTLLQELHDARTTISRLTAHHARSIGWDTRLTAALKERDDMQQERDSESHRARLAESRFAALKDKTIKLQTEVRRLQEALEEKRSHRLESSGTLLQDAKATLGSIREAGNLHTDTMDGYYEEVTRILESLVQDNETLKHDNDELQHLLTDTREDFASLQEEFEEYKANPPAPRSGGKLLMFSFSLPTLKQFLSEHSKALTQTKYQFNCEPLTTDANQSFSPTDSLLPFDIKETPKSKASSRYSPSHYSFEIETPNDDQELTSPTERRRSHKPLLLLSRSRGVQTEPYPSSLLSASPLPSLVPSLSPHDHSEASSFSDSSSIQMASLIERVASLLGRMIQTDPLTMANRLKRQNLKGADVGHLSKTTISNILAEVNSLRQQYRSLLEEDKAALPVTRKDLRGLFKFLRDAFMELGHIRDTLNEIILDPSLASKISEHALHPERKEKGGDSEILANPAQSWITPISRLFSPPRSEIPPPSVAQSNSSRHRNIRPIPKLGPALAASTTTVKVEFSGVGGRFTTNVTPSSPIARAPPVESTTASTLMDIFAGAPQLSNSTSTSTDAWVVVPPSSSVRHMPSLMQVGIGAEEYPSDDTIIDGTRTIGRNTALPRPRAEIPRAVDAVIDDRVGAYDQVAPLVQRALRRRVLSDSSLHSTFTNHDQHLQDTQRTSGSESQAPKHLGGVFRAGWPDGSSVFQALSRTVQNLKLGGSTAPTAPITASEVSAAEPSGTRRRLRPTQQSQLQAPPQTSANVATASETSPVSKLLSPTSPATSPKSPSGKRSVTISPRKGRMSDFTSWAAASFMLDPATGAGDPFIARSVVGSFREESFLQRASRTGDEI
ncbi:hypothetical protein P691DRAFT_677569 [Macrolepiota fuliginosa MF-IS2]|uniref:Uncharacterized protein n=1 Tax=Macrolepiota fuliginosa MF-IS2 TaxID=1400762 RepID=A0A9P5X6A0_9AGAR|nr:hypothetical protein P691DRAFT_677569 [Macrolepiota fuliginosa MF-IS2]